MGENRNRTFLNNIENCDLIFIERYFSLLAISEKSGYNVKHLILKFERFIVEKNASS